MGDVPQKTWDQNVQNSEWFRTTYSSTVNIYGADRDIQNWKTNVTTAIPPAFGEKKSGELWSTQSWTCEFGSLLPIPAHFNLSVVCHIRALCLNLDAIWQVHVWGPITHCVRWGPWPPGEGKIFGSNAQPKHAIATCCSHLANGNEERFHGLPNHFGSVLQSISDLTSLQFIKARRYFCWFLRSLSRSRRCLLVAVLSYCCHAHSSTASSTFTKQVLPVAMATVAVTTKQLQLRCETSLNF